MSEARCALGGVEVIITESAGTDGAMIVFIDTKFEPDGSDGGPGLRVMINDDDTYIGVPYGTPDEPDESSDVAGGPLSDDQAPPTHHTPATYDLNAGGAADPGDHEFQHDPALDSPEGHQFCWCGWARVAHLAHPRTCILTDAPGEDPDDCTTHNHEPGWVDPEDDCDADD